MKCGRALGILVWRQMESSKGRGPGQRDPAHVVLSSQLHSTLQLLLLPVHRGGGGSCVPKNGWWLSPKADHQLRCGGTEEPEGYTEREELRIQRWGPGELLRGRGKGSGLVTPERTPQDCITVPLAWRAD